VTVTPWPFVPRVIPSDFDEVPLQLRSFESLGQFGYVALQSDAAKGHGINLWVKANLVDVLADKRGLNARSADSDVALEQVVTCRWSEKRE
jgi:hypothetical protein